MVGILSAARSSRPAPSSKAQYLHLSLRLLLVAVLCFIDLATFDGTGCTAVATDAKTKVDPRWKDIGNFSYFFNTKPETWHNAKQTCRLHGASLLDIQSAAENGNIYHLFPSSHFWIGYNDISQENTFFWSRTGLNGSYTNWNAGEPNNANGDENCVAMLTTKNPPAGKWNDINCNNSLTSVCKKGISRLCNYTFSIMYGGYCYFGNGKFVDWNQANSYCKHENGCLADIQSAEENAVVTNVMPSSFKIALIGLNDIVKEGSYVWKLCNSSRRFDSGYRNWAKNEPNDFGGHEDCTRLLINGDVPGKWTDSDCKLAHTVPVCKKDTPRKEIGGFYYFINPTLETWIRARQTCLAHGASLVDIQSAAENLNVSLFFPNSFFWIGYNDIAREGQFVWNRTGMDGLYRKWNHGEPNNALGGEDCVAMFTTTSSAGNWLDVKCNGSLAFVCKKDVDECSSGNHNCSGNTTCTNNYGGFSCAFNNGTFDVNECNNRCHANATCRRKNGNYACTCVPPFVGNGQNCTDTNECADVTHPCHHYATCMDTIGSYTCTCLPTFVGNGTNCADVDECSSGNHNCSGNATCTNKHGGFSCAFNNGRFGTNIDECFNGSHTCSANATCVNNNGSYSCICNQMFTGNGRTCKLIECPELKSLTDGLVLSNSLQNKSIRLFECNPGYTLVGPKERLCQSNGNWSGMPAKCKENGTTASKNNSSSLSVIVVAVILAFTFTVLIAFVIYKCHGRSPSNSSASTQHKVLEVNSSSIPEDSMYSVDPIRQSAALQDEPCHGTAVNPPSMYSVAGPALAGEHPVRELVIEDQYSHLVRTAEEEDVQHGSVDLPSPTIIVNYAHLDSSQPKVCYSKVVKRNLN